ncbi:MAG: hypothetical protein IH608_07245 [Proteobacteria bacterium]|nr:hypothetical protein [Pseudomonadota bacterium]
MMRRVVRAVGAACCAVIMGCAGASVQTYSKPATGQRLYGKVKKVAVLPFDSVVEGAQAPRVAGDLFLQELLSRGTFEMVEEPRYVNELMKKLKLRNTEGLDREIVRKMGEELQAQGLILGDLMLFGQEDTSEVVEFALQINMIDVESGDILWSGKTYASASTTFGEILGVNQGPSQNDVAGRGVSRLVARLDREFRRAREDEVERMLEAAKAQGIAEEGALPPEAGAPSAIPQVAPEQEAEEILLQVKPK